MTAINLLNSRAFCSERGIFNLEPVDSILKVLNMLYMLHICAGNQGCNANGPKTYRLFWNVLAEIIVVHLWER